QPQCKDSEITVRIVGEFSAGKSRLIRELLTGTVPPELLPVSRLKRETLVPLEITYGDNIALWEIRKNNDFDKNPEYIRQWDHFPQREEFSFSGEQLRQHRLRLTVPLKALMVDKHPVYPDQKGPFRIFLIDTPGWNSGESDPSAFTVAGGDAMACVYVVHSNRLDSQTNQEELKTVLEKLREYEDLIEPLNLPVYVTHWPEKEDSQWQQEIKQRFYDTAEEAELPDPLIQIEYLDFDKLDNEKRLAFQENFWEKLRAGWSETVSASSLEIRMDDPELFPLLESAADKIEKARQILDNFRTGDEFIPHMNMTRVKTYPQEQWTDLLQKKWGIFSEPDIGNSQIPEMASDHPLCAWWNSILLQQVKTGLADVKHLTDTAKKSLNRIDRNTSDLNAFLTDSLGLLHEETRQKFLWTAGLMPPSLTESIRKRENLTQIIATLIAISICQSEIHESIGQLMNTDSFG
ncbi:MAG: dynamin family protein, partial [Desulfococcaceae bacterium]|nr:dynamin family protein [Desulfococcaceae bacterium]